MAILRNKRKVAAVSRKTPENRRNGQSPNALDPEVAQKYISRVCEEIERRIIKKTLRKIQSDRVTFLGAQSKLDEIFLNPKVRTCSIAVLGTSRNNGSENRELTRVRSLNDPCPKAVFSLHDSGILIGSELEESHYMVTGYTKRFAIAITWWQELKKRFPTAPLELRQENKRSRALRVSHKFALKKPLQLLKHTRFCWRFNILRRTVIQPTSTTTSTDSRNYPNPSQQQCPPLTGNERILNCLESCSKQVWNFTINWQKKTK